MREEFENKDDGIIPFRDEVIESAEQQWYTVTNMSSELECFSGRRRIRRRQYLLSSGIDGNEGAMTVVSEELCIPRPGQST